MIKYCTSIWRSMIFFESESHYIAKWFHSSHFSRCNNSNNYTLLALGGLSGATSFYINISFPSFKIFLTFFFSRTRRTRISVDFPYFRSLLIFTPRQQGWLASTISHFFACKTHEIYTIWVANGTDVLVVQPGYLS